MSKIKSDEILALVSAAKAGFEKAYAPYSNFHVGAAALTASGKIVKGCNVENASYGLTVCAERNCLAQGVISGEQVFKALVVYTNQEKLTPPCGACRQVIVEFLAPDALVMAVNHNNNKKQWTVNELLPDAFTPKDLLEK
ncbi:cytidine deaminase [Cognaticolwellia beringensis]|uniref:Cytidine deaminase n=1 Tax=Cognaticolwellia beringensis TaxID=1967665 RepID=A0A222GDY4_9GAMM|nr:cytidine deaminase [Cognaticolwellia beringensis]ASP50088.1 cytidine deaminase [Cognaticolwellia beringensis]